MSLVVPELTLPVVLLPMTSPSMFILLTTISPRAVALKPHSLTPEDVWEAPNETPSWAASSVPSGVSQEDLADAQHTKALVDRWQRERGEVQQNLEFASSTKGDLWLRWGKQWLLLTNKNKPGEFLAPSTLKRYRVDVAKALGVYKSTGLSPQDAAELKKND